MIDRMTDELPFAFEDETEPNSRVARRRRRRAQQGERRRSGVAFLVVAAVIATIAIGGWWGFGQVKGFFIAPDYTGAGVGEVTVQIKKDWFAADIGKELEAKGVVKSAKAFVNAAKGNDRSREIQPGYYKLMNKMKASVAVTALLDPKTRVVNKFTIKEGWGRQEAYAEMAAKTGIPKETFERLGDDPAALGVPANWLVTGARKPPKMTIEGFLYPETYEFEPGASAEQIMKAMVNQFLQVADDVDFVNEAETGKLSPYEALTVASLLIKEGIPEDYRKIARVVYNRLAADMPLQFDSCAYYWLKLKGIPYKESLTNAEIHDRTNPYNVADVKGLPPGPIDSPERLALDAAVNPEKGPWLYFVTIDKTGRAAFATTFAEHEKNIVIAKRNGVPM